MATSTLKLEKNKLTAEDIEIGLGTVIQKRQGEDLQLTQLNATHLLAPLVVDAISNLQELNPNLMTSQTVIVKENHTIYTWDSTTNSWVSSTTGLYVVDNTADLVNIPEGYNTALCGEFLYTKINGVWTLANTSVYAVNNYSDIESLPNGVTSVIVKTSGTMYYKQGLNWTQVQFSEVGDNISVVDNITDLAAVDSTIFKIVFLNDGKRSGMFFYDEEQQGISDGGIYFNGWVRQYDGNPSLYWYGVKGDGVTDDTAAIGSYLLQHSFLDLNEGTYNISRPLTINKSIRINGNNATLVFGENVKAMFIGSIQNPLGTMEESIALGQSTFQTSGTNNFKVGDVLCIKGTNPCSAYSTSKMASFLSNVAVVNGTTITLTQAAKSTIQSPTIAKVDDIIIEISNLKIVQESSTDLDTVISFEYCRNVKLDNVMIQSKNVTTGIEFKNCYNTQMNACDIRIYGTNATALKVIDSDNTIIKSSNIFGQLRSIHLGNDIRCINQIGIFECIIATANASLNDYAIYCEDAVIGMSVHNSQIAGNIQLGGSTHRFNNCIISCYDKITPKQMNGGEISFINCTLIFLITEQQNIAFGNGASNGVVNDEWFKVTSPMHFEFVDNTFVLTNSYSTVLQLVAVPTGTNITECKHSISYYGNVIVGNATELALYGPFNKVRIESESEKVDLLSIFTASVNKLATLGISTPKCATMQTFFTLGNYPTKKLCFKDVTVEDKNIDTVDTSVVADGKTHSGTTYTLNHPISVVLT